MSAADTIYTIGHSTHPLERFEELLAQHRIEALADVRSFPSSRRWPHFNREALAAALSAQAVAYHWLRELGGRRHSTRSDSPHSAWIEPAFRAYADYADGAEFDAGLEQLAALARPAPTALMCSEGLWWRCHRRLIADHLLLQGWRVAHIMPTGKLVEHQSPAFAAVVDGRLVYNRT